MENAEQQDQQQYHLRGLRSGRHHGRPDGRRQYLPAQLDVHRLHLHFEPGLQLGGGRVLMRIDNMDNARRTTMKGMVDSLGAEKWTPLPEPMWEAYRYFGGQ